jgi:GTPase SAR1 family protein
LSCSKVEEDNKEKMTHIMTYDDESEIDAELGGTIKALWNDPGILLAWKRRAEFHIVESVKYYFNEIDRIMLDDYIATQQDMLLARVRTSGIVTEKYVIDGKNFEMYDVGGQRNERKKWIHCFEDVTAVIFVAALSEYDQVLFEDTSTNRMVEAIQLFDEICNNKYFMKSNMILFLNKKDLFEEKITSVHIGDQEAFQDFSTPMGSDEYYENGVDYFLEKFISKNTNPDRQIYHHVTCATDSKNVEVVFDACKDIILRGNLEDAGL